MTDSHFRLLISLSVALLVAAVAVSFIPGGYSDELAAVFAKQPARWPHVGFTASALFSVAILIAMVTGTVGLYLFKPWARPLSLYTTIAILLISPIGGPLLSTALEAGLSDASSLLWGAVLALSYFGPPSVRFGANSSFKPKPLRGSA